MTRRGALRGLAAGSALLLTGCGEKPEPAAGRAADLVVLEGLLTAELRTLAAYRAAAGALGGRRRALARRFEAHERAHADALRRAIRELGGTPSAPPAPPAAPPGGERALRLAAEREQASIAAHLDGLGRLSSARLRGGDGPILATAAAHLAVLRDELGEEPAPAAFVTGAG